VTLLVRAHELTGRPVVSLDGDLLAEVKDVVFDRTAGRVDGFTLNNPGLFSRRRRDALPWSSVHSVGRDAVMVADPAALAEAGDVATARDAAEGNVLGDRVLTDTGTELGTVTEVILEVGDHATVVGYEVEATAALGGAGRRVLIPLPATLAVSGEMLVVPAAVTDFVADDLAGFGAAVEAFRARLTGSS
jgi:uncharacterized protein YrrD